MKIWDTVKSDWNAMTWRDLLIFCAATFMFLLFGPVAHASAADPKLNQILDPTVFLRMSEGSCTGELVYSAKSDKPEDNGKVVTLVLTAKHCADDSENLAEVIIPTYNHTLRKTSYVSYMAAVRGKSSTADIALFELQDTDTVFTKLTKIAPKDVELEIGEPVWSSGYPLGGEKTITEGLLGPRETHGDEEWLRATPDIAPGNSGGGLYHKNAAGDFELIGVTVVMARGFSFYTGSVPIDEIRGYLKVALPTASPKMYRAMDMGGPR